MKPRRTPQTRAADILRLELARLIAKTAKSRTAYEQAQTKENSVRHAIALLDQLPSPGLAEPTEMEDMDKEVNRIFNEPMEIFALPTEGLKAPPNNTAAAPTPYRIGEKVTSCPHSQTGIVGGVRRCFSCNARV